MLLVPLLMGRVKRTKDEILFRLRVSKDGHRFQWAEHHQSFLLEPFYETITMFLLEPVVQKLQEYFPSIVGSSENPYKTQSFSQ